MSKSAASALALAASCLAGLLSATLSIRQGHPQQPDAAFYSGIRLDPVCLHHRYSGGAGLFASLRVSGLRLNLFAILIVILGGLVTAVLHKLFNIPLPVVLGIFSGAVTNTPALGPGSKFCAISAYRSRWSIKWG